MAECFAEASAWIVQSSVFQGNAALAESAGAEGTTLAQKILALRPGNKKAIYAQAVIATNLAGLAVDQMRTAEALDKAHRAVDMQQMLVSMDPGNTVAHNNYSAAMSMVSDSLWSLGRIRESIEAWDRAVDSMRKAAVGGAGFKLNKVQYLWNAGRRHAESGDFGALPKIQAEMVEQTRALRASLPKDSPLPDQAQGVTVNIMARVEFMRGNPKEALRLMREALPRIESLKVDASDEQERNMGLYYSNDLAASAAIDLGDFAAAEKYSRAALEVRKRIQLAANFDLLDEDLFSSRLALTLLALNRRDEAAKLMGPVLKRRREIQARNRGDQEVAAGLATALYVQGLVDARQRDALLNEAATLISKMPREYRNIFSTRYLSDRISDAQLGVMPWYRRPR
jgi:tetratricopeptide (TPR) repeat protein